MKYEIVNIASQYKEGNITATEAMNDITGILFPGIYKDDVYIKRLVAFMWDIETSSLNMNTAKTPFIYAKTMYTKLLKEKHECSNVKLGHMTNTIPETVRSRIVAHDRHMEGFPEYKKIYNIIQRVL